MPPKKSRFAPDDDDLEEALLAGGGLDTLARDYGDESDPIFMSLDYHAKGVLSPKSRNPADPVSTVPEAPQNRRDGKIAGMGTCVCCTGRRGRGVFVSGESDSYSAPDSDSALGNCALDTHGP